MVIHRSITNSESHSKRILVMSSIRVKAANNKHPNNMPNKQLLLTPESILLTQAKMNPRSFNIMEHRWLKTTFRVQHLLVQIMEAVSSSTLAKDRFHIITTSSIVQITWSNSNIVVDLQLTTIKSIRHRLLKHPRLVYWISQWWPPVEQTSSILMATVK